MSNPETPTKGDAMLCQCGHARSRHYSEPEDCKDCACVAFERPADPETPTVERLKTAQVHECREGAGADGVVTALSEPIRFVMLTEADRDALVADYLTLREENRRLKDELASAELLVEEMNRGEDL